MSDTDENRLQSPITRILPELLSAIFVAYFKLSQSIVKDDNYNPRLAPLTVASVCQMWRQVACSTSELWSVCWLSYTRPELNILWLARAGTRMLDLNGELQVHSLPFTRFKASSDPFLKSIAPYMQHCRTFSIKPDRLSVNKQPTFELCAPNLVSCKLIGKSCPQWLSNMILTSIQSLQSLEASELSLDQIKMDSDLPNVVELQLGYVAHADRVHQLLIKSPKLRILVVKTSIDRWPPGPFDAIMHATLTHLDLCFLRALDIPKILDALTLPSLRILAVHVCTYALNQHEERYILALPRIFQRSRCIIKELTVNIKGYSSLLPILESPAVFSSLETLTYKSTIITDPLLSFLAQPSNLPSLRKLYFDEAECYNLNLLANMVRDRRASSEGEQGERSRLEVFKLHLSPLGYTDSVQVEKVNDRIQNLAQSSLGDEVPLVVEVSVGVFMRRPRRPLGR